jgi:hypothetical protein
MIHQRSGRRDGVKRGIGSPAHNWSDLFLASACAGWQAKPFHAVQALRPDQIATIKGDAAGP